MYTLLIGFNLCCFLGSFYEIWFNNGDSSDFICLVFAAVSIVVLGTLQIIDERANKDD